MKKVLFVCVHNSIRSQMAEGLAREHGRGLVEAYSAGIYETGVNPLAIKIMKEIGIDISNQRSKTLSEFNDVTFDYVISVCTEAEATCPVISRTTQLHWPTVDPGKVKGTPEEVLTAFRQVRDELKQKIVELLAKIKKE